MHADLSRTFQIRIRGFIRYWCCTIEDREQRGLMSTLSTNIALNALHALIFVSTVSTNKIATQYTIALLWSFMLTLLTNIALNALHALIFVSTNKIPTQYTIALLWSFVSTISTCLHVHSNYNADSNMKSSNYSKIRLKPLIYFELQQNLN